MAAPRADKDVMRALHICAALSGALALALLAYAHHALGSPTSAMMAAIAQLSAACAGIVIARGANVLGLVAGWIIVACAALFASVIYLGLFGVHGFGMLAPIGGGGMIVGWALLAFAKLSNG